MKSVNDRLKEEGNSLKICFIITCVILCFLAFYFSIDNNRNRFFKVLSEYQENKIKYINSNNIKQYQYTISQIEQSQKIDKKEKEIFFYSFEYLSARHLDKYDKLIKYNKEDLTIKKNLETGFYSKIDGLKISEVIQIAKIKAKIESEKSLNYKNNLLFNKSFFSMILNGNMNKIIIDNDKANNIMSKEELDLFYKILSQKE